ncbi:MAG: AMP-binding protein [Acidimicrobiia bacterium]|nr:AMP-binding protein [Acidimicrobiia bacterium]
MIEPGVEYEWFKLGDLVDRAARLWPDRPAVIFEDRRWTWTELAAEVDRVAKGLMAASVGSGDHVAVWMTNRPEWVFTMFAAGKVGACLVPLNTRYRSDDAAFTVADSQASLMITLDRSGPIDFAAMLREARPQIEAAGHLRGIVVLDTTGGQGVATVPGASSWAELMAGGAAVTDGQLADRAVSISVDQLMMLAYTSGTTGHPKGVQHSHRPLRNVRERAILWGNTFNDVHMGYLPLFHLFGFSEVAVMAAITGACQVMMDAFDGERTLDLIEQHGANIIHGFDSHYKDLLAAQARHPRDLSSLRYGTLAAGMESTTPTARAAQEALCPTVSGYGMSEVWAFTSASHQSHSVEQRTEASGFPCDGIEYQIRNLESGREAAADVPGALYVRGYTVTRGYWQRPEANAQTIDADGWLDTGDLARVRPDGHLVFMGRHKDMLKVGGENVSPAEVEGYLLASGGIQEIAVVGYPDPRLAEVPVAYVIPSAPGSVTAEELIERCKGRIASFKIPRHVFLVDALPMTPSGKIRKVELRAMAIESLGDPNHA